MKKILPCSILSICLCVVSFNLVKAQGQGLLQDQKELFRNIRLFTDSIALVSSDYIEKVSSKDLVYGAIRGMMDSLDEYSQFLDPKDFTEITEETKGQFGGIGVQIGMREGILTVLSPMENTPADEAGLKAGDRIVRIDGKLTSDMSLDDAVDLLRGEAGTDVSVTVFREDDGEIYDHKIKRAVIKLKSVKDARIIEDAIGYIRIEEFQERTSRDLRNALSLLAEQGADSYVLDIRNNPGGLLEAAIECADLFLEPGQLVVYTEGRDGEDRVEYRAKKEADLKDGELVVLVNKASASAAEIMAGAIKDNSRGLVVGTSTFGKGSVQTVIPLPDQCGLRLTTAAYYTPSGSIIRKKGIMPDIVVKKRRYVKREKTGRSKKNVKKKKEIFERVKSLGEKSGNGSVAEKTETSSYGRDELLSDNQIETAVNVIKGMKAARSMTLPVGEGDEAETTRDAPPLIKTGSGE